MDYHNRVRYSTRPLKRSIPCPCGGRHLSKEHICAICKQRGFNHKLENCLDPHNLRCPCGDVCHNITEHECRNCGKIGFQHHIQDCIETCPCGCLQSRDNHYCPICRTKGWHHPKELCPQRCSRCPKSPLHGKYVHYCYVCRKIRSPQHTIKNCSQNTCPCGDHSKENHICFWCKQIGFSHLPRDCPQLCPCCNGADIPVSAQHTRAAHKCQICNKVGFIHLPTTCPQICPCVHELDLPLSQIHSSSKHKCRFCKKYGFTHLPNDCWEICPCMEKSFSYPKYSQRKRRFHVATKLKIHSLDKHRCRVCQQRGFTHLSNDCPIIVG